MFDSNYNVFNVAIQIVHSPHKYNLAHIAILSLNMETNKQLDLGVLPKIIDIEWKLEVVTNAPGVGSDNLLYTVILKTDSGKDVRFTCGSQQLHDLVYKLKDLVRHCEKTKGELT